MKDVHKWTIPIPTSIYVELKHMSFDEGRPLNDFCQSAIDAFQNQLIIIIQDVKEKRRVQEENARLARENPIKVNLNQEEPLAAI